MAEAFVSILIHNLRYLLEEEIGVIMGVDKEMKKLQSTLTTIQSVLEDAEAKQFHNKSIHNWLTKLNVAAFDIEDILDECSTEASKLPTKFNLKKILFSRKMGRRIKDMTHRLDHLAAERNNFHLSEIVAPQEVDCRRESGSVLIEGDHIYGRDEDRESIMEVLLNQESKLSVLPIVGIGGLGKTTLAQLVFNDERVTRHFEDKLWVCVSDNFCIKFLIEAMIQSATGSASNLVQLDALQSRIREVLNGRRYLLVLDDVWSDNQEDWAKLRSILDCGSNGASIVVTTRLRKVAEAMGTLPPFSLKGLSEEDLWSLFKLRAFGQEQESEAFPGLETIGRKIVRKCGGVPLAAKALGGLLRFKRREKEWIHVRESEIWEEETMIMPALRLSYHHLPLQLRQCFAYCAVFPKDYEIEKQDLIFHWIALGCIKPNRAEEVEDVGERIWNELVLRSFFHQVKELFTSTTTTLEILTTTITTTAKMHDLVHDLAQSILENKVPGSSSNASNNKVRKVYFTKYYWENCCSSISLNVPTLSTIMSYPRLRILKLNWARVETLPKAIAKLKHLRYLDLSSSQICILPPTFCNLWNLQILIINDCILLEALPKNIKYMTNLRHVFLDGCPKLSDMPCGIKELTHLKTLTLFIVGNKAGNQLDQLQLLKIGGRLEIRHLERAKSELTRAKLVEKPNLAHLILNWEGESAEAMDEKVLEGLEPHPNLECLQISGYKGRYAPVWMKKMENLSQLNMRFCRNLSRLPLLGDLPRLKSLYLWGIDALEYIVDENGSRNSKFASLERLRIANLPNLRGAVEGDAAVGCSRMFESCI
ncbi:putative disease resistance protein RGA3 [Salvia splendens]|uniref:putative disease resistance protein RGA3 n=1 Tax=Salvia splendens TaxID=180675 RepID=UPI001C26B226|nr:putative disease resistance protein RGA3 [Salvia splendens]XP_042022087.1 putative disease resistance protein RGA3 [Salvia splendens]XP_042022088.1 putative disease resistance protein RGA3 [Salvia splendens]